MKALLVSALLVGIAREGKSAEIEAALRANLAGVHERLAHRFDKYRITSRVFVFEGGVRTPVVQSEVTVDGDRRLSRVLHFLPKYQTPDLAERYDDLVNWVALTEESRIAFWEKSRVAEITGSPPPPRDFNPREYTEKLFVKSAYPWDLSDKPVRFEGTDSKQYRCYWRDFNLSDAFRQPGWVRYHIASPSGLFCLRRWIAKGLEDTIWVDPKKGYAMVRRELSFGENKGLTYEYDDFRSIGEGLWVPWTCRWWRREASEDVSEEKVIELHFRGPSDLPTENSLPPGTKITDLRTNTTRYLVGGEDLLDEMIDRLRYQYDLTGGAVGSSRSSARRLGLAAAFSLGMVVCLALRLKRPRSRAGCF